MTKQEAIKAIQVEGLEITGKLSRVNEFIRGLVVAEEALGKMAGIERALERLEKEVISWDGQRGYMETAFEDAIKIIKEEVG